MCSPTPPPTTGGLRGAESGSQLGDCVEPGRGQAIEAEGPAHAQTKPQCSGAVGIAQLSCKKRHVRSIHSAVVTETIFQIWDTNKPTPRCLISITYTSRDPPSWALSSWSISRRHLFWFPRIFREFWIVYVCVKTNKLASSSKSGHAWENVRLRGVGSVSSKRQFAQPVINRLEYKRCGQSIALLTQDIQNKAALSYTACVAYRANTSTICDTISSFVPLRGSRSLPALAARTLRLTCTGNREILSAIWKWTQGCKTYIEASQVKLFFLAVATMFSGDKRRVTLSMIQLRKTDKMKYCQNIIFVFVVVVFVGLYLSIFRVWLFPFFFIIIPHPHDQPQG